MKKKLSLIIIWLFLFNTISLICIQSSINITDYKNENNTSTQYPSSSLTATESLEPFILTNIGLNGYLPILMQKDWTIMFYGAGDNNLEGMMLEHFNQLEEIGSTNDVNLIGMLDRHPGHTEKDGDWTDTRIFKAVKDLGSYDNIISQSVNLGEQNLGDPQTLSDFIDYCKTNYPAKHYALFLFDHGSGPTSQNSHGGVCWDSTDGSYLSLPKLKTSLSTHHLDVVVGDTCKTAFIEYYTALGDYVDYFVASQVNLHGNLPYRLFLKYLIENPWYNAGVFSDRIVKEFKTANPNKDGFSASNCYYSSYLLDGMKDLSKSLMETITLGASAAINFARNYAAYNDRHIDLWEFVNYLEQSYTSGAVHENASHVRSLINLIVTENHATDPKHHGLSIYFPKEVGLFVDKYRENSFAEYTGWDDFLISFYANHTRIKILQPDIYESNDIFSNATALDYVNLINFKVLSNIVLENNDVDLFKVNINSGNMLTWTMSYASGQMTQESDLFSSQTPDQVPISLSFMTGPDNELDPDTYFIDLEKKTITSSITLDYTGYIYIKMEGISEDDVFINVSCSVIPEDDIYEENDDFTGASNINSNTGRLISNLVCLDDDFYSFQANEQDLITVDLFYNYSLGGLTLELYRADGRTPILVADSISRADNESLQYVNSAGDDIPYIIRVLNSENNTDYQLLVNLDASGEYDDIYEENDFFYESASLPGNGIYDLMCFDDDFFKFELGTSDWLTVNVTTDDKLDLHLYYNNSGNMVVIDKTLSWSGSGLAMVYAPFDNMTVYLKVNSSEHIYYSLNISIDINYIDDTLEYSLEGSHIGNDHNMNMTYWPYISMNNNYTNLIGLDQDNFQFNLDEITKIGVLLNYNGSLGDLWLGIYHSNGTLLGNAFTSTPAEYFTIELPAGTYSVCVDPRNIRGLTYNMSIFTGMFPEGDCLIWKSSPNIASIEIGNFTADSPIHSYIIDWGDNSILNINPGRTEHTYNSSGEYFITMGVFEKDGDIAYYRVSMEIIVERSPLDDNNWNIIVLISILAGVGVIGIGIFIIKKRN